MKAQQAPASLGQASLLLPRHWALTRAHCRKRQPNTTSAASSNSDSAPMAGVGNQVSRQRSSAGVAVAGTRRGSIRAWRT